MFVGHGAAAFAVVAVVARLYGCSRRRALALGVAAGAFATLPDVDIVYAPVGMLGAGGVFDAAQGFWSASTLVHRAVTHSLVVGVVAAVAFWLWSRAGGWSKPTFEHAISVVVLAGLVAVAGVVSGSLGAFVMAVFCLVGLVLTEAALRYGDLAPRAVLVTALVGLVSHPFGDLFTGEPPAMFYPFDVTLISHRLIFTADPTLNLFCVFWLELLMIWLAAVVYCSLTERRVWEVVHERAALGFAYAAAVLVVPAPTIDSAYVFVFSVLGIGIVGPAPLVSRLVTRVENATDDWPLVGVLTGLAAVTLASLAYAAAYLAL